MKKNYLTIILCLLSLLIGIIIGYLIFNDNQIAQESLNKENINQNDKENENDKIQSNDSITENNSNETTDNDYAFLNQLTGVWGHCKINELNNQVCYVKIIEESEGIYSYSEAQYQTGGGIVSEIKNIKQLDENKYELEIYSKGYDGPHGSSPERTSYIDIDISKLESNIILVNQSEYEYITDNWSNGQAIETYFSNQKTNG